MTNPREFTSELPERDKKLADMNEIERKHVYAMTHGVMVESFAMLTLVWARIPACERENIYGLVCSPANTIATFQQFLSNKHIS